MDTELEKAEKKITQLRAALEDANQLLVTNVKPYKLDTPKYWNIVSTINNSY